MKYEYERCLKFGAHFRSPTHSTPKCRIEHIATNTQKLMRNQMRTTSYRNYGFIVRCVCRAQYLFQPKTLLITFAWLHLVVVDCIVYELIMQVRCFVSRSVNCGDRAPRDNGNACENDAAFRIDRRTVFSVLSVADNNQQVYSPNRWCISDQWSDMTHGKMPTAMRIHSVCFVHPGTTSPSIEWQSKGWN